MNTTRPALIQTAGLIEGAAVFCRLDGDTLIADFGDLEAVVRFDDDGAAWLTVGDPASMRADAWGRLGHVADGRRVAVVLRRMVRVLRAWGAAAIAFSPADEALASAWTNLAMRYAKKEGLHGVFTLYGMAPEAYEPVYLVLRHDAPMPEGFAPYRS